MRAWQDRLAEASGGVALAIGVGGSAVLLSPRYALGPGGIGLLAALGLIAGWLLVRIVPPAQEGFALGAFEIPRFDVDDSPVEALLLDDRLAEVKAGSRVVQLFATGDPPTAGALHARIEQHLGRTAPDPVQPADATDALHAALEEIRRSLRQR